MKIATSTSKTLQNVMVNTLKAPTKGKTTVVNTKVPTISKVPINTPATTQPIPITSKPTTQPIIKQSPSQGTTLHTTGTGVNPGANTKHPLATTAEESTKKSSMTMPIIGAAVVLFLLMMKR